MQRNLRRGRLALPPFPMSGGGGVVSAEPFTPDHHVRARAVGYGESVDAVGESDCIPGAAVAEVDFAVLGVR